MAKLMDKLIVIDVESTCWEPKPPPGEKSEIIEIGYTLIDIKKACLLEFGTWIVKPEHSSISDFCTKLTSITPELIEKEGVSFKDACSEMKSKLKSNETCWSSWGDYDRNQFQRNCQLVGIKYPFGVRHINIKTLFAIMYGLDKEVGMPEALDILGIPLEGTHHRGVDDSRNIANIFCSILRKHNNMPNLTDCK